MEWRSVNEIVLFHFDKNELKMHFRNLFVETTSFSLKTSDLLRVDLWNIFESLEMRLFIEENEESYPTSNDLFQLRSFFLGFHFRIRSNTELIPRYIINYSLVPRDEIQ